MTFDEAVMLGTSRIYCLFAERLDALAVRLIDDGLAAGDVAAVLAAQRAADAVSRADLLQQFRAALVETLESRADAVQQFRATLDATLKADLRRVNPISGPH